MRTRKELDCAWMDAAFAIRPAAAFGLGALIAEERAFVDRAAQARAIRWIAAHWRETYALNQHAREWSVELDKVADCIERGELVVPEEP